jgi:hypothetical protein
MAVSDPGRYQIELAKGQEQILDSSSENQGWETERTRMRIKSATDIGSALRFY